MLVGYARVSDLDQNPETQLEALEAAGCERVFVEKASGKDKVGRPILSEALGFVRDGDMLLVTRLDRFGRSAKELLQLVSDLNERGVGFRCVLQPFDTTKPEGKLLMTMLAGFAEFELNLRAERQKEGVLRYKAEGGYKRKITPDKAEQIEEFRLSGLSISEAARRLHVDRGTIRNNSKGPWGQAAIA